MTNNRRNVGFTIVELLVVISIIALLVGILVPAVQKARDSAKTTQSKSNIHQVMIALANYASDHNDRNFSTAPDNLSSGERTNTGIIEAIEELEGPNPMGMELGDYAIPGQGQAYVYYLGMFGNAGNETGGIAPYCFHSGNTTSSTGKAGYGVWRYPNAGQVAVYMNGQPLHKAYFAPKDVVPARAMEACQDVSGTYCPSTAMAENHSYVNEGIWTSNMLQAPSSYCISPSMMYNPAVYQWDPQRAALPKDPMNIPRGFKPPSTDQAKYPSHKTWLMEHNWLQNVDNNECGVNWQFGTWFDEGDGCWDHCEPEHFNSSRHSEPVTALADGSTTVFSVSDAAADGERVRAGNPFLTATAGLWLHGSNMSFDASGFGPYYSEYATDWVHWGGHTHTLGGIRGRDKLAK